MVAPTPLRPASLHEEVATRLRQMVFERQLAPGDWIDELKLAGDWQISRTPLREALKVLAAEGLVTLVPRQGCKVTELSEDDADELFPVMAVLEGRCAFEAVRKASPADIKGLRRLHDTLEKHAAVKNIDGYYRANHEFHSRVQALAANRWLDRAINDLRLFVRMLRGRQLNWPGRIEASIDEHRAFIAAFEQRDAARAQQIMHDHLLAQLAALKALRASEQALVPATLMAANLKGVPMLDELRQVARRASGDRALRKLLADCRRLLSERGEANSVAIAGSLVDRLGDLPEEQQHGFFDHLARDFSPEPLAVLSGAQAYAANPNAETLMALMALAEPARQELFRRINRAPGGTAALLRLRRALLGRLREQPQLKAVEADLFHLLSSWFNPGFLQMRKVDWNSPARLLEKVIRLEAVHEVDGWDDLRRRLEPDRRLFAFFHPQLPDEPLIFVEVALVPEMPPAIAPLINKSAKPLPAEQFKVAAFYSISNCEPGLRGVSLGNFLIKRVAEQLKRELPQLKTFCTLSPIPGFAAWLAGKPALDALPGLKRGAGAELLGAHASLLAACGGDLTTLAHSAGLDKLGKEGEAALLALCSAYLMLVSPTPEGDPVARFHLDNGARLERLNPRGNLSRKGLKQSHGLMVNYLYDLQKIEASHEKFVSGEVAHSRAMASLM